MAEALSSISSSELALERVESPVAPAPLLPRAPRPAAVAPDAPDDRLPGGGFPWGLALALVIVLGVELGLRAAKPRDVIPYELGLAEHYAVASYLDAHGPGDIVFLGSSRTREGIDPTLVRDLCRDAGIARRAVVNYGVSSARADEAEAIVRKLLRSPRKPKIILYGISPRDLRGEAPDWPRLAIFWRLGDWWRELMDRRGDEQFDDVSDVLPEVLRNEVARHYLTLKYRQRFGQRAMQYITARPPDPCPVAGERSPLHLKRPRSIAREPVARSRIRRYVQRQLNDDGTFTFDAEMIDGLRNVLTLCRQANVKLIVFEMPISRPLQAEFPPGTYERFLELVQRSCHDASVQFLTLQRLRLTMGDIDFRDQSHLNFRGATKLTRALTKRVIIPRMLRSPAAMEKVAAPTDTPTTQGASTR